MAEIFKEGWFSELDPIDAPDPSICTSLKINELIHRSKSEFQDIMVFKNEVYGKCLVLDKAIQCSELDEFAYQEMISFLPLNIHPNPQRVLIIGGGDGGVAREVAKHPLVKAIVQCEIDREVVEVCKKHLPFMTTGFESEKVTLHIDDGYKYVLQHKNEFDVIITDSSDPNGPAVTLFESDFYQALFECLKPEGVISCQAESYWLESDFIRQIFKRVKNIFPSVSYATTSVPSYPGGQIGFILASKNSDVDFKEPKTKFTDEDCENLNLKYYSATMHRAAFSLPKFAQKKIFDDDS